MKCRHRRKKGPTQTLPAISDDVRFTIGTGESTDKHLGVDVPQFTIEDESIIISTICYKKDDEDPSRSVNTSSTGPRIFTLNIFDKPNPDPKIYLEDAWGKLKPAIGAIFLNEPKQLDPSYIFKFIKCPSAIQNAVCDAWWENSGEALYERILNECETHISRDIKSLEGQCNEEDEDPSVFLSSVVNCWLDFLSRMRSLCDIAGSEGQRVGWKELSQLGEELFPKQLKLTSKVHDKVLSTILDLITDQRSGKSVDTSQLYNLMSMFYGPSFYKKPRYFEERFVNCATEFYSADSKHFLERYEIPKYLKHIERRFREEKENCNYLYFFQLFREPLMKTIQEQLLVSHASLILEKGFVTFMDESRHDDLRRMYALFSEANLLDRMNNALSSYISETGGKSKTQGSSSLVQFKRRVDKILFSDFSEDRLLKKTVKLCFEDLGLPC